MPLWNRQDRESLWGPEGLYHPGGLPGPQGQQVLPAPGDLRPPWAPHIPGRPWDPHPRDALRPCVAPGAVAASRTRVSGRTYRACISSGASCAGCAGKSLGADRAGFPSVALGAGTAGIALDSLRARRPLVPLRPGGPTLTAGGMALILVAVARIALIHLKHFLSFFKKGTYHVFFYK